jgi:hypothetical protein
MSEQLYRLDKEAPSGYTLNVNGDIHAALEMAISAGVLVPVERCEHRDSEHPNGWLDPHDYLATQVSGVTVIAVSGLRCPGIRIVGGV